MESRDCQDGSAGQMDMLIELELFPGMSSEDALEIMRRRGLEVHEVSFTMKPPVEEKFIEPGSMGTF